LIVKPGNDFSILALAFLQDVAESFESEIFKLRFLDPALIPLILLILPLTLDQYVSHLDQIRDRFDEKVGAGLFPTREAFGIGPHLCRGFQEGCVDIG